MTDTAKLRELLARAESATGPEKGLEWEIADAFGLIPSHRLREIGFDYEWFRHPNEYCLWKANDSEGRNVSSWAPERVTSSIDAAIALCERVLPKLPFISLERYSDGWYSKISKHSTVAGFKGVQGANAALALCAAIIRAKIAELENSQ